MGSLTVFLFSRSSEAAAHTPGWPLGHFETLLVCALAIAIVLACVLHSGVKQRTIAAIEYFVLLVLVSIGIGWLMFPISH